MVNKFRRWLAMAIVMCVLAPLALSVRFLFWAAIWTLDKVLRPLEWLLGAIEPEPTPPTDWRRPKC